MARSVTVDPTSVAECVLRLAVLLQAGVTPQRAWTHLASVGDAAAEKVVAAISAGATIAAALGALGAAGRSDGSGRRSKPAAPARDVERAWQDVAAAWEVAVKVGAPLAESLRGLASTMRDVSEAADDVRVAMAEPASTARLMGWLPLVAIVLGVALGFDTIGTLLANPIGWTCLGAGASLIVAGQRWNAALVARARSRSGMPGLDTELLAIALSGGVSIDRAKEIVDAALAVRRPAAEGSGTSPFTASGSASRTASSTPAPSADEGDADDILALSRTAGVPAVELLRAASALARHRARIDGRLRAARLSSRLLLPLGVCTLPAFLLLGVAPMLLSVMTAVPLQI